MVKITRFRDSSRNLERLKMNNPFRGKTSVPSPGKLVNIISSGEIPGSSDAPVGSSYEIFVECHPPEMPEPS